jgi:voltage-gated potassium channel Kch
LKSAHIGEARILALCIDDIEASFKIVQLLNRHYPSLHILARARNRHHEIRLRNLKVDFVIRETLLSSLEFTRQVLVKLGCSPENAGNMIATFTKVDSRLIEQQVALVDDQDSMRQTTKEAAIEFRRLLQSEQQALPARKDKTGQPE